MKRILILLTILTACTPSPEPGSSTTRTTPLTSTTPPSTTPAPFDYRIGMTADVGTLNPWSGGTRTRTPWTGYVLDRTAATLYAPLPDRPEVQALLAAGPPPEPVETEDGTWEVVVEVEGSWSDGTSFTTADIAFTFEVARRFQLDGLWETWFPPALTTIEAVDEKTLRLVFSSPPGLAVWPYGPGRAPIQPAGFWAEKIEGLDQASDLFEVDPTGAPSAGAFVITDRQEGTSIGLTPNPDWPGWSAPPTIDSATYLVYPSLDDAQDALTTGEVDVVIDPEGFETGIETSAPLAAFTSETNGFGFVAFNLARPVTSRPGFREVVAHLAAAFERPAGAGSGGGVTVPASDRRWYDPTVASDLTIEGEDSISALAAVLEADGFTWSTAPSDDSPGVGLTLAGVVPPPIEILVQDEDPVQAAYASHLTDRLTRLGFDIALTAVPLVELRSRVFQVTDAGFDYDLYLAEWKLGSSDFPAHHRDFFGTLGEVNGRYNNTGFSSTELDGLLDRLDTTRDREEAKRIIWEIETIIATERPYVVLYTKPILELYRADRVAFPFQSTLGGLAGRGGAPDLVEPVR